MQTAPWWGVPVIAGGFLIIGAVLGFLSNFLMEGIRHRREDVRYFRSKLIDAIAEFVDASQEMRRSRIFKHTASQDIKASKDSMNQQYHRMYRQTVIFRILSADAPFNLAAEEALNSIYMFNYDAEQYKAGEYLDMEKKAIKLEEAFIAAARNAVGVAVEKKATTRRASRD